MASAVSPSASDHDFDSSRTIIAENSCLRLRMIEAIRSRSAERSSGGTRDHVENAAAADSTARSASSFVP
jgi:hypothetical protein